MPTIDVAALKEKAFEYFDVETIKNSFGGIKEVDWNPFEIKDGKPVGFSNTFISIKGAPFAALQAFGWAVEKAAVDLKAVRAGGEKKKALVSLIDDLIKLPFWAEPFDAMAISWVIDVIIDGLNRLFGNNWIDHVATPELVKTA